MKRKTKSLALVALAIVLSSVFLVALPGIAADQKQETQKVSASEVMTTSEDDFLLEIYGNANEDDTIDMRDYTYTARIICWLEEETTFADANYDGRISVADMTQIGLIILGRESELTFIDSADRIETVKKPIERIVATYIGELEMMRTLEVPADHVVGVPDSASSDEQYKLFFPEHEGKPGVGSWFTWDVEAILELNPDVVFLSPAPLGVSSVPTADMFKSAGVTPLLFWCSVPDVNVAEEMRKLGYIFDKEQEAEEYLDWYEGILNSIKEKVEKIPEEDIPSVYFEMGFTPYYTGEEYITNIEFGGGKTIFPEVTGYVEIDREAVAARNPDIIVKESSPGGTGYGYDLEVGDIAGLKSVRDEIMSRPELQNVAAVKNGRVYAIAIHIVSYDSGSGGRAFLHKVYMAKWLQPELFEDLDPKAIHQEYLTRFQGLDIDLDEKGVFVYHPEKNPYGY